MSLQFQPTRDMDLVKSVMCHPKVYPYISDDGSPKVEDFKPVDSPSVLYLLCKDGEQLLGLWMFVQTNSVSLEVHTCLLPHHGFTRARLAAKQAAEWIWANTECQRIVTNVPAFNGIALSFAQAAGMTEYGLNPASFAKGGKLWDQRLLGISRPKENT